MKRLSLILSLLFIFLLQDIWALPIGRRLDINSITNPVLKANLAAAMLAYIDEDIVEEHSCNNEFGNVDGATGGIHGPEMFLNWHRMYLAEMEADPGVAAALAAIPGSNGLIPRWTQAFGLTTVSDFTVVDGGYCNATDLCGYVTPSPTNGPGSCAIPSGTGTNTFPAAFNSPMGCTWTDTDAFSEILRQGYHNNGHGQLGGAMWYFTSPITPIFWLWHSMIDDVYWDYQNQCISNSDIHIKDTPGDNASEPNNISPVFYASSDIWIRQDQDTPTAGANTDIPHGAGSLIGTAAYNNEGNHEDGEFKALGDPNYVYVRIRNESTQEFSGGRLRVYWSKASTGHSWPTTWNNYSIGSLMYGDEITPTNAGTNPIPVESNFVIPPIPANSQFVFEIPWVVPDPALYPAGSEQKHFCLLARIVSPFDEMDTPEVTALGQNLKNNNNIALKNVAIYNLNPNNIVNPGGNVAVIEKEVAFMGVYVTNAEGNEYMGNFNFLALRNKQDRNIFDIGGLVYARMDEEFFHIWEQSGLAGSGVKLLGEYNGKFYVAITEEKAQMAELLFPAKSQFGLEMGYALPKKVKGGQEFEFDIQQTDTKEIISGERYIIRITKPRIREAVVEAEKAIDLLISPNPARDQFTVSYNLETEGNVSIALYDISGRIVNQIPEQSLSAGYQTELMDATNLAKGIYILRVQVGTEMINRKVVIE